MAKYLGVAEARDRLSHLVNEMDAETEEVVILRYSKPRAVLVAWERWQMLQEEEQDAKDLLMDDADALHALYSEFADEDLELATLGTAHYAHLLRVEEGSA